MTELGSHFYTLYFFYLQCFSLSFAVAPKHKHSFPKSVIRISHFPFFLSFFFFRCVCVCVKSGGARLSFSSHFRWRRKKTQKAAAVLAVFFLFHRQMMHIQFFWKFEKVLFFALHVAKWNTRRRRRYLRPRNISAFFVEAAIASQQNQRMGGGTLSKQYAYKNPLC